MSDTGKQQFTAYQSIYQLSDKYRCVPDDIDLWRGVWTRLWMCKNSRSWSSSDVIVK